MSHRNAGPCGYVDGLTLLVSGMLRGSRHRSSPHLKDFLRSAQGQGGGTEEDSGDGKRRVEDEDRLRAHSPWWLCNYIQSLFSHRHRGEGAYQRRADWAASATSHGSDRK